MIPPDQDFWQEASKWLAGIVLLPIGYVWKKVNSSVQKEEFSEFCTRFEDHCKKDSDVQAKLFDQIRDSDQRAQDRYERLMERLSK